MAYSQHNMYGNNGGYGVPSSTGGDQQMYSTSDTRFVGGGAYPSVDTAQQLLSNPMVTQAAMQYGQGLVSMGQSYIDNTVNRFAPGLKLYFAVDTNYVLNKLRIILLPYTHRDWSLQYSGSQPLQPRQDINAPDLYIPIMGLVTYILLSGFVMGTQNRFTPEDLGVNASSLLAWLLFEIILIWLALFLARVTAHLSLLDIIAYCSYKYISMIISVGVSLVGGVIAYYISLAWTTMAIAYFEVQSLRLRVHPDVSEGASRMRNYILLIIAIIQPLMVLWLTWSLVMYKAPPTFNSLNNF